MTINVLELKRICEKYNKGPVDLRIEIDYYCIKLHANFLGARVWRRSKAISYQLFEKLDMAQFESLVDDFMDEFISEVKKQEELPCDSISDEVRAYPLHYEPTPFLLSSGLQKKIEEEVFRKGVEDDN
jgi:hypothetical protein